MTNDLGADFLCELRRDLAAQEATVVKLRRAITALEDLNGVAPARRTGRRGRRPNNAPGVPEDLGGLGASDRILQVMRRDPQRRWTNAELVDATFLATSGSVRGALGVLAASGQVVRVGASSWALGDSTAVTAASPSDGS